jgi:hypothetical protein
MAGTSEEAAFCGVPELTWITAITTATAATMLPVIVQKSVRPRCIGPPRPSYPSLPLTWPLPADRRFDQLVELANEEGADTGGNEMAAAIIAGQDPDPDVLLGLVLRWRRVLVADVVIGHQPEAGFV